MKNIQQDLGLEEVEERYQQLNRLLSDPEVIKDQNSFQKYAKEHSQLTKLIEVYQEYKKISNELADNQELLGEDDEEIQELAKTEIRKLKGEQDKLKDDIKFLLLTKDRAEGRNIFLEIRAGTGGGEASLFAANLFRMYSKFAELNGWKVEIINQNITDVGGFKEIIVLMEGKEAFSKLKYESGVHRVQRVPATESQGRIHTSAVTVAIIPEADDVEVDIEPKYLKIDVFRSSGPGGQSVNTTDSAVRITHLPTGIIVSCQDEKSQHKNKAKAMRVLKAKVFDKLKEEEQMKEAAARKSQIGSGDRSERIRTYNFPQGRVTDHRLGLTLYKLDDILLGNLDDIINPLITHYQTEALKEKVPNILAS